MLRDISDVDNLPEDGSKIWKHAQNTEKLKLSCFVIDERASKSICATSFLAQNSNFRVTMTKSVVI